MTITKTAGVLALAAGLAGCQPPSGEAPANQAADNLAMAEDLPANDTAPTKSILRPEVVPIEPPAPVVEPAEAVIAFGASGLKLDDAGRKALDALLAGEAMALGGPVTLRGHSDTRGSDGDNRVASRLRAEAVRDYLRAKGVAEDRITLIALGEDRPLVPNAHEDGSDDPEGRAKNRRVEVLVALPTPAAKEADDPTEAVSNTTE